jgi:hypothetical protein
MGRSARRRRVALVALCLALLGALVLVPETDVDAQPPVLFGSSAGQRGNESPREAVERLEGEIGRQLAIVRVFKRWDAAFPTDYDRWLRDSGHAIFLSVAAQRVDGSHVPWSAIANAGPGSDLHDRIVSWAERVRDFGSQIYFSFDPEPETGNLGVMGSPSDFAAAWRRVVSIFRDQGVSNARHTVTFTAYTYGRPGSAGVASWYPGDEYVDALGADGYNFFGCSPGLNENWRDFAQVFDPVREFGLAHPSKPIVIGEWGSVEDPNTPGRKADWIAGARSTLQSAGWEQFEAVLYWHSQTPGCEIWVDTSQSSIAAFAAMGADPYFSAGAAPVVGSIDPPAGRVGTVVAIGGSNFSGVQAVTFDGVDSVFSVSGPSSLTATVPAGATTGPIEVVTQAGRALGPVFAIVHGRDVTMQARGDGQTISGALHVEDGFAACLRNQQVKVQRRGHAGRWRTIRNTMSRADGSYRAQLPDLPGAYRVRLPRATLGSGDICGRGKSPVRHL